MEAHIHDRHQELIERIDLVEAMIAEGKNSTARRGWIFVTWGFTYILAVLWNSYLPQKEWAWPICIGLALIAIKFGQLRQRRRSLRESTRSRSIDAVWSGFGKAVLLYVIVAGLSHRLQDPSYEAAVLIFFGGAHAMSATILRWRVQWAVAILWFAAGAAAFFVTSKVAIGVFIVASLLGLVCFGLYVMALERTLGGQDHA